MIPNQWYVVLESKQVQMKPVGVTRMGEKLVFWRDAGGKVSCLRDRCVHRGAALSEGQVLHGQLQCPFHGFEYDASGQVTLIPANGRNAPAPERFKVHAYLTHEAHGWIWIWWGEQPPVDLEPPLFFDDIDAAFYYATIYDPWSTHYSRVIENQLDVVHLPFVHHNTIGRGNRALVDGPGVEWVNENQFNVYVFNRVDDGTPPRRPDEVPVPDPTRDYRLEFIFPNLWQNRISEKVRVLGVFVPVDDEHTLLYLRFYQKFMKAPVLGSWIARVAMPFNRLVAHQDRRIVQTQVPKPSSLQMGERLIQGDRPIVEYRRRRQELKQAAGI
ncbi:MAG: aromatic ring-hydroxylating dioxygenase subunit alpha [Anaerolineae bacterium]|nr:aromatic ring-hydroxylating dioxygenase subunit alpha [Anaerolineae bacterium]